MFETARRSEIRLLAAVLLALTTILVGFAHLPPAGFGAVRASAADPAAELAVAAVCGHVGAAADVDGGPTAPSTPAICDACLLTDAPGLGAIAELVLPVPSPVPLPQPVVREAVSGARPLLRPTSRGPPFV